MVLDYYNAKCGSGACSREWEHTVEDIANIKHVIDILPGQTEIIGGTMRLGNYTTHLSNSNVSKYYNCDIIVERHRHRYEVNNQYVSELENAGLKFVGRSKLSNGTEVMEITELSDHPFYIGCQFHPEYKSRYENPHPLFLGLLKSIISSDSKGI